MSVGVARAIHRVKSTSSEKHENRLPAWDPISPGIYITGSLLTLLSTKTDSITHDDPHCCVQYLSVPLNKMNLFIADN